MIVMIIIVIYYDVMVTIVVLMIFIVTFVITMIASDHYCYGYSYIFLMIIFLEKLLL